MLSVSWNLAMDGWFLLVSGVFALCLTYVVKRLLWRLTHRLPPGPWGLPLVGYNPFLGPEPYLTYMKLGEKYGGIFGLQMGTKYAVILNDFALIKDALNREEFLDRPEGWFHISDDHDHLVNMNGWEWKEMRKFTVTTLRNLGVGKNKVEDTIKKEISELIGRMEKDGDTNLLDAFHLPLLNVILFLTCGRTVDDGERLLKIFADYNNEILREVIMSHDKIFYPFLRPFLWLKGKLSSKAPTAKEELDKFLRNEIESHMIEFDETNLDDFVGYYLKEMKKITSPRTSLTLANLHGNVMGLFFAGTDTTQTTLAWVFLHLAHHQEAQQKIYREIVDLLGSEKPPSWADKDCMPYTNAFIYESARVKTLAPADDPHWSSKDGTIGGYFIPKDSIVLANVGAVHCDKKLWGDPENFRPERFLSADGTKATAPDYWIPFLIGKRVCPGAKMANMQIFLFVAFLVQRFKVVAPESGLNDSYIAGLTLPVKPLVRFQPRT